MKKFATAAFGAALMLGLSASHAAAGVDPYNPVDCSNRPDAVVSGQFTPGGSGVLGVTGAAPNCEEPATIQSAPFPVNDTADANGRLDYAFGNVPADFELGARHTITFTKGGSLSFCVATNGFVADCSLVLGTGVTQPGGGGGGGGGSSIPRTGADYVDDGLRAAAIAITGGALLLLWRRRATTTAPSAG